MRRAVFPLVLVFGFVIPACSVRVGQGPAGSDPADGGAAPSGLLGPDAGPDAGPGLVATGDAAVGPVSVFSPDGGPSSACAHVAGEVKIPAGAGTKDFSFLWDQDHYVFAYVDPRYGNGDIYTILVNADGTARGPATVVQSTPAASALPSLLATSTGFLVAWEEGSAGLAVYVHALDQNAQPVGQGVTVASTSSSQARPVLAQTPTGVAITWMDSVLGSPAVDVAMLDANLNVTPAVNVAPTSGGAGWPWLAGTANGAALAWTDHRAGQFDIHFANLNAGPTMQGDEALRTGQPNDSLLPRMIPTSFGYFTAWEDMRGGDNQIFMSLVDPNGQQLAAGLVEDPNTGDANWPNIAWDGSAAAVVYYQWRYDGPAIFLSYVNASAQHVLGLSDLEVSATPQGSQAKYPDVQWNGSEFGVAWIDNREGTPQLYFSRVACHM